MKAENVAAFTIFLGVMASLVQAQERDFRCLPGFDYYERVGTSLVICGCSYDYHAESSDGTHVCAGGLYDYRVESSDGSYVACGGLYDYRAESSDGTHVCAGGRYDYRVESSDGSHARSFALRRLFEAIRVRSDSLL